MISYSFCVSIVSIIAICAAMIGYRAGKRIGVERGRMEQRVDDVRDLVSAKHEGYRAGVSCGMSKKLTATLSN